jgi:colicin import membrane protein
VPNLPHTMQKDGHSFIFDGLPRPFFDVMEKISFRFPRPHLGPNPFSSAPAESWDEFASAEPASEEEAADEGDFVVPRDPRRANTVEHIELTAAQKAAELRSLADDEYANHVQSRVEKVELNQLYLCEMDKAEHGLRLGLAIPIAAEAENAEGLPTFTVAWFTITSKNGWQSKNITFESFIDKGKRMTDVMDIESFRLIVEDSYLTKSGLAEKDSHPKFKVEFTHKVLAFARAEKLDGYESEDEPLSALDDSDEEVEQEENSGDGPLDSDHLANADSSEEDTSQPRGAKRGATHFSHPYTNTHTHHTHTPTHAGKGGVAAAHSNAAGKRKMTVAAARKAAALQREPTSDSSEESTLPKGKAAAKRGAALVAAVRAKAATSQRSAAAPTAKAAAVPAKAARKPSTSEDEDESSQEEESDSSREEEERLVKGKAAAKRGAALVAAVRAKEASQRSAAAPTAKAAAVPAKAAAKAAAVPAKVARNAAALKRKRDEEKARQGAPRARAPARTRAHPRAPARTRAHSRRPARACACPAACARPARRTSRPGVAHVLQEKTQRSERL